MNRFIFLVCCGHLPKMFPHSSHRLKFFPNILLNVRNASVEKGLFLFLYTVKTLLAKFHIETIPVERSKIPTSCVLH